MLRELTIRHDSFPLAAPFRISRGTKYVADVVTVELHQDGRIGRGESVPRSEEHTSELQSLMRISYAVFCLKKKNITQKETSQTQTYFQIENEIYEYREIYTRS